MAPETRRLLDPRIVAAVCNESQLSAKNFDVVHNGLNPSEQVAVAPDDERRRRDHRADALAGVTRNDREPRRDSCQTDRSTGRVLLFQVSPACVAGWSLPAKCFLELGFRCGIVMCHGGKSFEHFAVEVLGRERLHVGGRAGQPRPWWGDKRQETHSFGKLRGRGKGESSAGGVSYEVYGFQAKCIGKIDDVARV
jgi:hypothetical protein